MKSVTLIDIIQIGNFNSERDLNDTDWLYGDIDIDERLDKDILIDTIIDQCGAMRCIYNTTPIFKRFSNNFFKKYKWNIGKLIDTLELKYDPITNKNVNWTETTDIEQNLDTEEGIEENREKNNTGTQVTEDSGTQTTNDTGTQTKADTGTQTKVDTGTQENEYSETQENTISAMNSSDYQPDNKKETSGENTRTDDLTSTRTDNLSSTRTDNLTSTRTDDLSKTRTDNLSETINATNDRNKNENLTWAETDTHIESGATGNVTFQELIEKERKIAEFSIYNWIAKKYSKELFLLVY